MIFNFLKRLSIQWKVSLATSFYILLVLFGAILLTTYSFEKKLINEKNKATLETIKGIIESYKENFVLERLDKIDELIQKLKEIPSLENVLVLNTEGKVIGSTSLDDLGKIDRFLLTKFLNSNKNEFIENIDDKTTYYYGVKIGQENIGYVISTYSQTLIKQSADREIFSVLVQVGAVAIFVIFASFLGTFAISGIMIRPLIQLKDKIINITSQDFRYAKVLDKYPPKKSKNKECIKEISDKCWLVSENPQKLLDDIGELAIKECLKCEKYKNLTDDEIEELTFSFFMMISSLKDYLYKLEEAHKERETLNCMATMGEMSAKIAHEIKNALYAIGNAAGYLKQSINNEIVKEFSGIIKDEVDRLNEMTVSFLNFSKLIEPKFEKNDLNKEINHTIMLLQDDFEEENINVIKQLSPIPEFEFDKNMIKQVLFNILLNAIDAIKEKNPENRWIKISTQYYEEKSKKFVVLQIEDNGIGIKEEHKEKIFKPFFTTKQKGTGLGLPMVYKIIFSHNGMINVQSRYKIGTKFTITFTING